MSIANLTLTQVAAQLAARQVSAREVVEACLQQLQQWEPSVHALLAHDPEALRAQALESDDRLARGAARGPLEGVPLVIKDNLVTQHLPTTAGSRMLGGYQSPGDATAVARLKAAGALILGKTNLDEFGMGSSTENSAFHVTANPFALERIPGGSSGGSAAAIAGRYAFGALGSDTGGSIRQPASFTHTVGLKPTWSRVSRHGLIAYASSLDCVGPIARTVDDVAWLAQTISGFDAADSTSSDRPVPNFLDATSDVRGLKIGVIRELMADGVHPEIRSRVEQAVEVLRQAGAEIREVSLPHTSFAMAAYYVIACAEASSNLARYDGVRYGHRAADPRGLADLYARSRAEGFGAEVKRRIMLGTFALSAGYHDAYYGQAQAMRARIRHDFTQAFSQVDVLLSPVSPLPPWRLEEKLDDPVAMYLTDVMTLPMSLAGVPALSVPCGFTDGDTLPVGVQLVGRHFDEATLFRAGRSLEKALRLTERAPSLPHAGGPHASR